MGNPRLLVFFLALTSRSMATPTDGDNAAVLDAASGGDAQAGQPDLSDLFGMMGGLVGEDAEEIQQEMGQMSSILGAIASLNAETRAQQQAMCTGFYQEPAENDGNGQTRPEPLTKCVEYEGEICHQEEGRWGSSFCYVNASNWGAECIPCIESCKVHIGSSSSNMVSRTGLKEGCVCPAVINKGNWLGGYQYGDEFTVSQNGSTLKVQRTDRREGWGMNLSFQCSPQGYCTGIDNGCCTSESPCKEMDGDCDNDDECEGDLICGTDNCVWGDNDDCCRKDPDMCTGFYQEPAENGRARPEPLTKCVEHGGEFCHQKEGPWGSSFCYVAASNGNPANWGAECIPCNGEGQRYDREFEEDNCQRKETKGEDYAGTVNKTKSGYTCQEWSQQSPHDHGFGSVGNHNYCRNPDEGTGVWCYTTNPKRRYELCDVPVCGRPKNNGTVDCQRMDTKGQDYVGTVNKTRSGFTCQEWAKQSPHSHTFESVGDSNYCRNPGGTPSVWCYTTDTDQRWELCDVPACQLQEGDKLWRDDGRCGESYPLLNGQPGQCDPTGNEFGHCCSKHNWCGSGDDHCKGSAAVNFAVTCQNGNGEDYNGNESKTKSGFTCNNWWYHWSNVGKHNYCRNTDGDSGVWCFANWSSELCDVPVCGKENSTTTTTTPTPTGDSCADKIDICPIWEDRCTDRDSMGTMSYDCPKTCGKCGGTGGMKTVTKAEMCSNYTELTEAWRHIDYTKRGFISGPCSEARNKLVQYTWSTYGFYRFAGAAGTKLPTGPAPTGPPSLGDQFCGTYAAPYIMSGGNPTVQDGIVIRDILFEHADRNFYNKFTIKVAACSDIKGDFLVYELYPVQDCTRGYCAID